MKIVFDTNVLIAAFITHGVCNDLLDHCIRHHELVTSNFILDEFREHLVGKFKYSVDEADEAIALLRLKMEVVTPARFENPVCRDHDDDMVLGTAIAGEATCIVTGDKDLLVLETYRTVDIVSPAQFAQYEADYMTQ